MPKHGSILHYVHGNQKAREDGQPRTATSTLTLFLREELLRMVVVLVCFVCLVGWLFGWLAVEF